MSVPTSDSSKKSAARDAVYPASNAAGQLQAAYWTVSTTSFSNKNTALTAIENAYDALLAAVSAVDALA